MTPVAELMLIATIAGFAAGCIILPVVAVCWVFK